MLQFGIIFNLLHRIMLMIIILTMNRLYFSTLSYISDLSHIYKIHTDSQCEKNLKSKQQKEKIINGSELQQSNDVPTSQFSDVHKLNFV